MKKIFNLGTSGTYPNEFCSHLKEVYFGYFGIAFFVKEKLDHIFCERKIFRRELSIVTENLFCQKKGIRHEDYEFQIELLR